MIAHETTVYLLWTERLIAQLDVVLEVELETDKCHFRHSFEIKGMHMCEKKNL